MTSIESLLNKYKELEETSQKLLQIGIAISSERDLTKLLNLIIDELKKLVCAESGTLYLIDKEKDELYFYITDKETLKEIRLLIDENSIAGYCAKTSKVLNIADVYEMPQFNKDIDLKTGYRTKSMLVVPMINHKEERIGVIQLINKKNGQEIISFNDEDLKILKFIASQAAVCIENAHLYQEIENLFSAFVQYSTSAIDARDPVTAGHSKRVAMYAVATAKAMGLPPSDVKEIYFASFLHDIGKIGVREYVLTKNNKLSDAEIEVIKNRFKIIEKIIEKEYLNSLIAKLKDNSVDFDKFKIETENIYKEKIKILQDELNFIISKNIPGFITDEEMEKLKTIAAKKVKDTDGTEIQYLTEKEFEYLSIKKGNLTQKERENIESHTSYTNEILSSIPFTKELKNVPKYAVYHHERLDGSGYGQGIKGEQIPLGARILALVDVYEALTAQDRPYKPAMSADKALKIIEEEVKCNRLDSEVFSAFVENKIYELKE